MEVTIVMYHYVRDLTRSRFPKIKGLDTERFGEQIRYIKKHYNVISGDDLIGAIDQAENLPPRPLLLTFDDGYLDHFTNVFPILKKSKLPGCFFPPAKCILENYVLDVNKIHFVLASLENKQTLVEFIFDMLEKHRSDFGISDKEHYWKKLAVANRFDPKEVVFIKRILQRELPEPLRRIIIDSLFHRYVTKDEVNFARELYMDIEQLKYMHDDGMHIGSHGYNHYWLDRLDEPSQEQEVDRSLQFLRQIFSLDKGWIMCYPYGAFDESLLSFLRSRNCKIGLTTKVGISDLNNGDCLTLPRLDTNDLPQKGDAPVSPWTVQVTSSNSSQTVGYNPS